jgi:hypothetical protein
MGDARCGKLAPFPMHLYMAPFQAFLVAHPIHARCFASNDRDAVRSGGRVVEGARLESEYTPKAYRGFESLPLRHPILLQAVKGLSGKPKTLWKSRSAMLFPVSV